MPKPGIVDTDVDTLIFSDGHLDEGEQKAEFFLHGLSQYTFRRIVSAGDLFADGAKITDKGMEVIAFLRANSGKLVCVRGNHDRRKKELFRKLLGKKSKRRYVCTIGEKEFCVRHGHQFDRFLFLFSVVAIDRLIAGFFWLIRKLDPGKSHLNKWLSAIHKKLAGHSARRAKRYAKRRGFDCIVCGHTHESSFVKFCLKNGRIIEYVNCGEPTDNSCTFAVIYENGQVEFHRVTKDGITPIPAQTQE